MGTISLSRVEAEKDFYNRYSRVLDVQKINPNEVFSRASDECCYLIKLFGDLEGKNVLDLGCGQGDTSLFFALLGAKVWAIDVSDGMVQVTQDLAKRYRVEDRLRASVMRAEELQFEDNMFDLIFADGVLHHIDLHKSIQGLVRVLKRGGKAIFVEPQEGNAFMDVYRFFAKDLRTPGEKPLGREELMLLESRFADLRHREFHFLTLPLFALKFISLKLRRMSYPYWMEEVRQGKYMRSVYRVLQKLDRIVLQKVPLLRKWCWLTVITGSK